MNILPIPALDGGYVLFLLVEVITGKKPKDKIEKTGELNNTITVKFSGDVEEWGK
jgi:regulator of sigma E protease